MDAFYAVFVARRRPIRRRRASLPRLGPRIVTAAAIDEYGGLVLMGSFYVDITLPSGSAYTEGGPGANVFLVKVFDLL